jgi:signal transduction histidine kinase
MSDIVDKLEKTTKLALKSKSVEEGISHLADAFALLVKEQYEIDKKKQILDLKSAAEKKRDNRNSDTSCKNVAKLDFFSEYLEQILKNIGQGILFINRDGVITSYNERAKEILKKGNVLNKKFWNHFSDDFFGFSLSDSLKYGLNYNTNFLNLNNLKEVEISTKYLASPEKNYEGLLIMLKDITEVETLKKEKYREQTTSQIGKIVTTVIHEIKNPLGAIRGYASLLNKDLEENEALREKVEYILEASKSLERIVDSILQYTRPLQLKKSPCDLCKILKEVTRSIKIDTSFTKKVKVSLHFSLDKFICGVDKDLIKLAFFNILINAYQSMEEGTISVYLIRRNDGCLISFSDTGYGMSEKQIEHIFSPFFTTKEEGNGLGLSETKKIIQTHGGSIDVTSKLGIGSTFTIYLPG